MIKQKLFPLILGVTVVAIVAAALASCHSTKRLTKSPEAVAKDSAAMKTDNSPSEFFE